jgi:hypothetical protein
MIDPTIEASYKDNIARVGKLVRFIRITGQAPRTAKFSADVMAVVTDYVPEHTVLDVKREGSITQGQRHLIVVNGDLTAKGFVLPIQKNDKVIVGRENVDDWIVDGEPEFNVTRTDPNKRHIAGATEVWIEGS